MVFVKQILTCLILKLDSLQSLYNVTNKKHNPIMAPITVAK